ncbi:MATE family efflux transporter [Wohlfahrtiimonas larvae]|uniref:Multidrug export protein MepA n=1 Tax=Wohlfahrtiimonas larvae TaxID=1157986 RepID=A0ABP9MC03_9GAMM|nr:MATE family efflux transporter [Wohlfahrtiimonas larvae]
MKQRTLRLLFISYVIPTLGAMLISGAYQLIDGFFIGHFIGAEGLAAVNIGWSYITILLGFGLLVGVGTGSLYSIAKGAENDDKARKIIGQSITLIIIPGVIFGAILYFSAPTLVYMLSDTDYLVSQKFVTTAYMAIDFIRVFAVSSPLVIGSLALPFLVRNMGKPYYATLYMAIGVSINILCSYLFIVVLEMSVFGAAIANILGESCAMFLGLYYIIIKSGEPLKLKHFKPNIPLIKNIMVNGASTFFMYIYVGFIMMLHHKMLVKYGGTVAVSAYTITGYIITIYYLGMEGIANGVQPIISRLYGRENYLSTRAIIRMMVLVGMTYGILLTLFLQLFPEFFTTLFTNDKELTKVTVHAINFHLPVLFLEGAFVMVTVFFQAIGEGTKALVISIGNLVIQIPFLLIAPQFYQLDGVWLAMPLSSILLAIPVIYWAYLRYRKI